MDSTLLLSGCSLCCDLAKRREVGLPFRADYRLQLRKNSILVRRAENSDAYFAVAEIQNRRETSNPVPEPEIGTAIEFDPADFQKIDIFSGDFVQSSVHHHGRKAPSRSKLDQHGLTRFQNFALEVRFIDFNSRFHTHRECDLRSRRRGRERGMVACRRHSSVE